MNIFNKIFKLNNRTDNEVNIKQTDIQNIDIEYKGKRYIELREKIKDNYNLLSEWELKRDLAQNPTEKLQAEIEIKKLKKNIQEYENELEIISNNASISINKLKDNPKAVISIEPLQIRASKLSGEDIIVGANTTILNKDSKPVYMFSSIILYKIYYYYTVNSAGEELIKLETNTYPPPSHNDKIINIWTTIPNKSIVQIINLVKTIFPLDNFDLSYIKSNLFDFNENGIFNSSKDIFTSNYGLIEVGNQKDKMGDTHGYIFFSNKKKSTYYIINKIDNTVIIVGRGDKPLF